MARSDASPPDASSTATLLEARQITRRFGAFTALDSVDFTVRQGEIHALLGENGAGKSTLMNILSGLLRPTSGEIYLESYRVRLNSPADAAQHGIGMVHQHFLLVPPMSVRENLLLGATQKRGGLLSYPINAVLEEAKAIADQLGWQIPWELPAGSLPVGTQQRIEILKALRGETKILIFDEPTAVLTPSETPELFQTIRALAKRGQGIVFISHKLDEVLHLAQRVTVLRRGKVVYRTTTRETTATVLAQAMVGAGSAAAAILAQTQRTKPGDAESPSFSTTEKPLLQVQHLTVTIKGTVRPAVHNLSFAVASGEIFGIAGVDGNGQAELADALAGLLRPTKGEIQVRGISPATNPAAFRHAGVALIPADRQTRGLALPLTLTENFALGMQDVPEFQRNGVLLWQKLRQRAKRLIAEYDIRATGTEAKAVSLSGGNQQKVVIARALSQQPSVIIAVNPTRGLDVGAIAAIHAALRNAQSAGAAIVLISTELDEVIALAHRIAVLYEGEFSGVVPPETPRAEIGLLMGGTQPQKVAV